MVHFAAGLCACALHEREAAVEPYGHVAHRAEGRQVTARPTAELEQSQRLLASERVEQRSVIWTDVVIARAVPKSLGVALVVRERARGDLVEQGCEWLDIER